MNENSYEELFEELWLMNPNGAKDSLYNLVRYTLNQSPVDFEGVIITMPRLVQLYRMYLDAMEPLQNGKYTKSENRIVDIDDYISQKLYQKSFAAPKKSRDDYIFGDRTFDEWRNRIALFKDKYHV